MIDPGSARTIARGAGFVKSFSIGQPTTGLFVPIDPASNLGCYRKNRKFVGLSLVNPQLIGLELFCGSFDQPVLIGSHVRETRQ